MIFFAVENERTRTPINTNAMRIFHTVALYKLHTEQIRRQNLLNNDGSFD